MTDINHGLTPDSLAQIDRELAKYPADQKRSAVMSALRIAQTEKGWLSSDTIKFVADYLGIAPMAAHEVATFYNMYDRAPVGKYKLTVCTNLPCALSGGADAGEYLQQKLGIGYNETTADGRFTLKEGECMGACGYAPVMLVNNHTMCNHMTPDAIDRKLAELTQAGN
ncbi:NADH-quinone oxidoreductase subunit NuoE [Chitinimonas sp. BJYL2]|uniref:NADH-quinone oxidoreductase subunit NuoE n=1 Tax=Chitinimonas sp. BJYL2 TaxID=2976696 RepID=UPI0022B36AEE|nr:NADH-quinone oxidoreductase subunit NuoE [Chitinimonas sp. BJYL2]